MVEMKVVHGNTVVVVGHKKYMVKLEGSTPNSLEMDNKNLVVVL